MCVFVTVAICTFNRAESLRRTLDSLAAMRVSSDLTWEVVIVNNNSTDHTDEVINQYLNRLPLRREYERRPGLSNARNRAIDTAKGEYILWTDDDVVVEAGWLSAYVEAFRRWPEAAVFGGRITPRYDPPVARLVAVGETVLQGPYAVRDFGNDAQPLSVAEGRLPFGANFAIRTIEQRTFRYDPNLGAGPNRRRAEEEIDVITRLLESGATGYWIPEAYVEHCIGRERQTIRYIADYYTGLGETHAFQGAAATAATSLWFGVPHGLWLKLLKRGLLYHFYRLVSPAPVWVLHLRFYSYAKGMFQYWWQKKE
jgi:glucosyl-dolichyl phosphate glucuronosyltransferase